MTALNEVKFYIQVVCMLGIILSCYACYVETRLERDHWYRPICDISENISCTKAFSSKWGKGFGLVEKYLGDDSIFYQPNGFYGIFFYVLMCALNLSDDLDIMKLKFVLSILSNIMSIYLGHILYTELQDVCLVCAATYFVNIIILAMCCVKWGLLICSEHSSTTANNKQSVKPKVTKSS